MKKMLLLAVAFASLQAFAQRYEAGEDSKSIGIKETSSRYELDFKIPIYRVESRLVQEQTTCQKQECDNGYSGDGSKGNWNGFFNVPKAQKPAALAASIKGIGLTTAERIVEQNLLTHKPDSWSEFTTLMYGIQSRLSASGCGGEVTGNGSKGEWHGFFNVPKAQKAAALAAAIKGIGPAIAGKIVERNLLTHKPDSWSEFSTLMFQIEAKLKAAGDNLTFAENVVSKSAYGEENRKNLGYGSSAPTCDHNFYVSVVNVYGYENKRNLGYEANGPICNTVSYPCTHTVMREFKTHSHDVPRHLSVSVKDQSLQSFENDVLEVSVSTGASSVSTSLKAGHNNYQASLLNGGRILELTGTRIKKPFPISVSTVNLFKDAANKLALQVNTPAQYFNGEDHGSELQLVFEVCKAVLFNSCKVVAGPSIIKVDKPAFQRRFDGNLGRGTFHVRVRMMKVGSQFYSNGKSEQVQSNKVKL